ncbi:hypothetical protein Tco_1133643 [Tanacetum coccineum]
MAAIAAKLEAIETMKEFIAALKEGDRSRSRGSNNSDGESGVLSIPDEEKVEIASMHLEGDALDLYAWLSDDHSLTFWEELVQAFTKNFGPIEFQNPDEFLYVAINKDRDIVAKLAPSRKKLPKSVSCNSGKAASYHDEDVLMNELKLATQPVVPFGVQIGNGDVIHCGQICKNLSVQINDLKITQDFHHFSLGGADLVLGVQWYREYDLAHLKLIFEFSIYTVWIVVFDSGIQSERSMLLMKIENKGLKSLLLLALSVVLQVPMMDDPNMTMKEYIKLEEEKARRRGRVFNWQTATYGKIRIDDDLHDLSSVEAEFPAIVINDAFAPQDALQCKSQIFYTAYPNPMDTAYRLSGRYPVFIFSTVKVSTSLKCWSLETSKRLFNTRSCSIKLHEESLPSKYQGSFSF